MQKYTEQQRNILNQAEVKNGLPEIVVIGHFLGDSTRFRIYAHLRKNGMKQEAFVALIQSVVKAIKKDTGINSLNVLHREEVEERVELGSDYTEEYKTFHVDNFKEFEFQIEHDFFYSTDGLDKVNESPNLWRYDGLDEQDADGTLLDLDMEGRDKCKHFFESLLADGSPTDDYIAFFCPFAVGNYLKWSNDMVFIIENVHAEISEFMEVLDEGQWVWAAEVRELTEAEYKQYNRFYKG